ncbi:hypothetical protein [Staphylococcus americanisciuri]|uniref:YopX protein domain-containing protein n=1 Tax=Staphylococcus americanisciuri TaxID=2973940 RepID=A0ABT2F3Z0_9STAP|nr:hypothetical protein [Staphylococcus americanisciuri]MCS4487173.1 hypothetical protein [Staphylococcus americanisciuri]
MNYTTKKLTSKEREELVGYDGSYRTEDNWVSWCHIWVYGEDIYAIEPYALRGDGNGDYKKHFYNRIQGEELEELFHNGVEINFDEDL